MQLYIYSQTSQSNILQNRRTPNSDTGLRVQSVNLSSGTEVFSTFPKGGPAPRETTGLPRDYTSSSAPAGIVLVLPT